MNLQQIETLLLQEMEDVKGGRAGNCTCTSGAGQSSDSDGTCTCSRGAAQKIDKDPSEETPECVCNNGAGQ